ncbi:PAS domain-containing protein [Rhodospirillaceae bacterium KN72]|uniref:PAS domain-containing protein n=1 Tax=Pacificispira spongiicola TaxID=2729598 RepID=A0A7Y0HGY7_9PROT|nr:PAS domain-containing protein [Pacificispira spongiicola]NMM46148.1 PAS domain-containing protein [Pacificispira spongiicola]
MVDKTVLNDILGRTYSADELRSEEQAWFHRFWCDHVRDTGRLPGRRDIDPVTLPRKLLPVMMIIDVERPPDAPLCFRYRLVGTETSQFYWRDPTGARFEEIYTGQALADFNAFFTTVVETRQPDFRDHIRLPWRHEHVLEYSRTAHPLATDGWTVDRVVLVFRPEYRR